MFKQQFPCKNFKFLQISNNLQCHTQCNLSVGTLILDIVDSQHSIWEKIYNTNKTVHFPSGNTTVKVQIVTNQVTSNWEDSFVVQFEHLLLNKTLFVILRPGSFYLCLQTGKYLDSQLHNVFHERSVILKPWNVQSVVRIFKQVCI